MAKTKDETATAAVRLYPRTRTRLKVKAAKENTTIAEIVENYFR